ncbi:MAG: phosphate acetyltransferase, partial [Spirochaetes bacterium]|nr:phosphate acetyltransferase [Spirochaetota bacterium]
LLGNRQSINESAGNFKLDLGDIEIINPENHPYTEKIAAAYAETRKVSPAIAKKAVVKPLILGGLLVKSGFADGMIAGAVNTSASVLKAALLTVGKKAAALPASFFIMLLPDQHLHPTKILVFADAVININPDAEQLAEIGLSTAFTVKKLLAIEPKIAFLSFSTKGSAKHEFVTKVQKAVQIAQNKAPDLLIDGEMQLDTAIIPDIAKLKKCESKVAGSANVLIFPDLNAANIGYKLVQHLAGARALGPITIGLNQPFNDLSRGTTIEDIVASTALTAIQSAKTG